MYSKSYDVDSYDNVVVHIVSETGFTYEDISSLMADEYIIYQPNCPFALVFEYFDDKKSVIRLAEATNNVITYQLNNDTFDGDFLENVRNLFGMASDFNNIKSKEAYMEKHKNEQYKGFADFMKNI